MYLAFRQACTNDKYCDKTAHAQTDPHVRIWRESAFGGNLCMLRCACQANFFFDARAKANFFYGFKIRVSWRKMITVVIKIKVDKCENYAYVYVSYFRRWSGYRGILLYLNNSRARVCCGCSRCGWDCLDNFSFVYNFFIFLPFPGNQLKYYLTGPLNRKIKKKTTK